MDITCYEEGPDYIVDYHGIQMAFSRLHEHHEEISGLVRVSLNGFPARPDGDLFDGKVILTGPRSMSDCAKACQARVSEFDDWQGLILKACIVVRRTLEEGSPIYDLADGDVEPDAPYAVAPLIRIGEPTLAFGPGGTGKSTLSLMVALVTTTAQGYWQLRPEGDPMTVLYLDFEDEIGPQRRRLSKLAEGLGCDRPHIKWKRAEASLPQMAEALGRQVAREKIDAMIIDSAGLACGAEPESADSANAYFRALRSLRLKWSLTIAHQPKAKERDPYPFGSVFWWNNPRMIWRTGLSRSEGQGGSGIHLGLWNKKANNDDLHDPMAFHMRFSQGKIEVEAEAARRVEEFRDTLPQPQKVMAILEDAGKPLTYEQLEKETGIAVKVLYTIVHRLGKEGQIQRIGEAFTLTHPASSPFSSNGHDDAPIPF